MKTKIETLEEAPQINTNLNIVLDFSNTLQEIKKKEELALEQASFTLTEDEVESAEIERLLDQFDE